MKVCFFTKYPPTEGGTASRSYWLARALGEEGVEVHIVTNSLEENLWREKIDFGDTDDLENFQPKNVFVHSLDKLNPDFNPSKDRLLEKNQEARLASLGVEVIERNQCGIIDSHYFFPHGVAAYMAKKITHRPLILRHAVSDITKVMSEKEFHTLFKKIFNEADFIFSDKARSAFFHSLRVASGKISFNFRYGVNPKYFNSDVQPIDLEKYGLRIADDVPVIIYMGKTKDDHSKGNYELVEAASRIKEDFLLLFVTGGPALGDFKKYIENFPSLKGKYFFLDFIPPWKIPFLLKRSACLVQLERDFPFVSHFPIQPLEAMAVGTCPLISEEIHQSYKNIPGIEKDKNILVANPKNIPELENLLKKIIKDKGFSQRIGKEAEKIFNRESFSHSIFLTIRFYEALAKNYKSLRLCLKEIREVILKYRMIGG